jgi:hypothetical protein
LQPLLQQGHGEEPGAGWWIMRASLAQGHLTFILMWPEIGLDVDILQMLLSFKSQGARLI